MRAAFAFVLFVALGAGIASPPTAVGAQGSRSASDQDLAGRWNGFLAAVKSRDAARVASFYTTDALLLDQGRPLLKGRAAIEQSMVAGLKGTLAEIVTTVLEMSSAGDVGYVVATFTQPTSAGGQQRGKVIMIWKRVNGEWMIAHDMFNMDGTASPAGK